MIKYLIILLAILIAILIWYSCQKIKEGFESTNPDDYIFNPNEIIKSFSKFNPYNPETNNLSQNLGNKLNTSIGNYFYVYSPNSLTGESKIIYLKFRNPIKLPSEPQVRGWYTNYQLDASKIGDTQYYQETRSPNVYYHVIPSSLDYNNFMYNSVSWNAKGITEMWILLDSKNRQLITIENFLKPQTKPELDETKVISELVPPLKTSMTTYINNNQPDLNTLKNNIVQQISQVQSQINSKLQGLDKFKGKCMLDGKDVSYMWWNNGKDCFQSCSSNSQSRVNGFCRCDEGGNNQKCISNQICKNNICVSPYTQYSTKRPVVFSMDYFQNELDNLKQTVINADNLQNLSKSITLQIDTLKNASQSTTPIIQTQISKFTTMINGLIQSEVRKEVEQNINNAMTSLKNDIQQEVAKVTISPTILQGINSQIADLKTRLNAGANQSDINNRLDNLKKYIDTTVKSSNPEIDNLINKFKDDLDTSLNKVKADTTSSLNKTLKTKLGLIQANLQDQVQKFSLYVSKKQTSAMMSPKLVKEITDASNELQTLINKKMSSIQTISKPDLEVLLNQKLQQIEDTYKQSNQQQPDFDAELGILRNNINYNVKDAKETIKQNYSDEISKYSDTLTTDLNKTVSDFNKNIVNKLSNITVGADITNKINTSITQLQNLLQKQLNNSQEIIDTTITSQINKDISAVKTELQNEMKQKGIPSITDILNKKFTTFQTQVSTNIQNLNNDLKTTLNQELDNRVGMINERIKYTLENQVNASLGNQKPELIKLINDKIDSLGATLLQEVQGVTPEAIADIQSSLTQLKINIQQNLTKNNAANLGQVINTKFNQVKSELTNKLSGLSDQVATINPKTITNIQNDFDQYKSQLTSDINTLKDNISQEIKKQVSSITPQEVTAKIQPKIEQNLISSMDNEFQSLIDSKFSAYEKDLDFSKQITGQINSAKEKLSQDVKPAVTNYMNSPAFSKSVEKMLTPEIYNNVKTTINSTLVPEIMPQVTSYYQPKVEGRIQPFIQSEVKKYTTN